MTITEKDFRTMLGIVGHPEDVDLADPLPYSILIDLRDLIPCGNVTFAEADSFCRVTYFEQEVGNPGLSGPEREAWDAAFWTHYWNTPACHYPDSTGDLDTVTTLSDFHCDRELSRSTPRSLRVDSTGCQRPDEHRDIRLRRRNRVDTVPLANLKELGQAPRIRVDRPRRTTEIGPHPQPLSRTPVPGQDWPLLLKNQTRPPPQTRPRTDLITRRWRTSRNLCQSQKIDPLAARRKVNPG